MNRGKDGRSSGPGGDAPRFDLGGSLLGGLSDLVENLAKLAETGDGLRREGRLDLGGGKEGVFGVRVRMGLSGLKAERFGDLHSGKDGPVVAESREPLIDLFEEDDGLRIVAELPGVAASEVEVSVDRHVVRLKTNGERRYAKDVALPRAADPASLRQTLKNGILELRLHHG